MLIPTTQIVTVAADIPIGAVLPWSASTAPNSLYLIADGSAISRATYSDLFNLYNGDGLPYGNGNGTTTFNLPDLRGRVIVGVSSGGDTAVDTLGKNDNRTATSRSVEHSHHYDKGVSLTDAQGGSGGIGPYNSFTEGTTTGDANNADAPAWLTLNFIIKVLASS